MAEFKMPILGVDMTEGKLIAWRRQPGDAVARGDVIAEVETDKAAIEVETFIAGVMESLLVQPGERVPVGTVLALIRTEEGEVGAPLLPTVPSAPSTAGRAPVRVAPPPTPHREPAARVSPVARNLAATLGVDITSVKGTGPGGRIQERDVRRAAAEVVQTPDDRNARMRRAIAAAMTRSNLEVPQFHLLARIDMKRALDWLAATNATLAVADRLLYGVVLIKAVAVALKAVPELNAVWSDEGVVPKPSVNVGVAIALRGGGLIAPALLDADARTLGDLMRGLSDLVRRARAGSLRSSEVTEATVTVTNLGEQGAESVWGLIYPPQTALVGFGRIQEQPWSLNGNIVARPIIATTLTGDHRAVDGHRGSVFLAALDRLLQEPERL